MGVVNVTPDSFSDGGESLDPAAAIAKGLRLRAAGADIIDVGGESTRPGAYDVSTQQEIDRVLPVVAELVGYGLAVSVDTRHSATMAAVIELGAAIINDVTALRGEGSLDVVARSRASVVLMHMQGEPATMQRAPRYADVARDVRSWLRTRVDICRAAGIPRERIAVDPGIGFGKTVEHNLELLREIGSIKKLGCAIVVGVSRKSFIASLSRGETAANRLPGSIAEGLSAIRRGAHILRVHDVAQTAQALAIWQAIEAPECPA
jgi:dihydropteroate synthase